MSGKAQNVRLSKTAAGTRYSAELPEDPQPLKSESSSPLKPVEVGCPLRKIRSRYKVTPSLLHAIESEIVRHAEEVKRVTQKTSTAEISPEKNGAGASSSNMLRHLLPKSSALGPRKESGIDVSIVKQLEAAKIKMAKPVAKKSKKRTKHKAALHIPSHPEAREDVLNINPYKVNPKLDFLELREMANKDRRTKLNPEMLPSDSAKAQYQVFADNRITAPVFNFREIGLGHTGKRSRAADSAGEGRVRIKQSGPQFGFRNVNELLATTRHNRKLQQETRLDVVTRIRETNRANMSMVIKRRMIDFLNDSVTTFTKDISMAEEEIEDVARQFDVYLHESDEKTIQAIQRAEAARSERLAAENELHKLETQNHLLDCHLIRKQDKIKLINRCINAMYLILPEEMRKAALQVLPDRSQADKEYTQTCDPLEEGLKNYRSLSEESQTVENNAQPVRHRTHTIPPNPLKTPQELVSLLLEHGERSANAFGINHDARQEIRSIQQSVQSDAVAAATFVDQIQQACDKLEKKVEKLRQKVSAAELELKASREGPRARAEFRKPLDRLQHDLAETFHSFVSRSAPDSPAAALALVYSKLHFYVDLFSVFPDSLMRKWFLKVSKDRNAEQRFLHVLQPNSTAKERHQEVDLQSRLTPRRIPRPRSAPPDQGKKGAASAEESLLEKVARRLAKRPEKLEKWRSPSVLSVSSENAVSPEEPAEVADDELELLTKQSHSSAEESPVATKTSDVEDEPHLPAATEIPTDQAETSSAPSHQQPVSDLAAAATAEPVTETDVFISSLVSRHSWLDYEPDVPNPDVPVSWQDRIPTARNHKGQSLMDDFFGALSGESPENVPESDGTFEQFRKSRASGESRRRSSRAFDVRTLSIEAPLEKIESVYEPEHETVQDNTADQPKKQYPLDAAPVEDPPKPHVDDEAPLLPSMKNLDGTQPVPAAEVEV